MRGIPSLITEIRKKVFTEVARMAYSGDYTDMEDIPFKIVPGQSPLHRESVFLERAIAGERVRLAMGLSLQPVQTRTLLTEGMDQAAIAEQYYEPPLVNIIPYACHACPTRQYRVNELCQGCLASSCQRVCPKGAIKFVNGKSRIDQKLCIKCGKCARSCPYNAITYLERPCQAACGMDAIGVDEYGKACIDYDRRVSCGQCLVSCPFGAIVDKSFLLDALTIMRESENNTKYKVYAVVAPSISSQFSYAKTGQVVTGLRKIGFHSVIEAALGADMVAYAEAAELVEKGFLTSSCCPAFVAYIKSAFPGLVDKISHNPSPMEAVARFIKRTDPTAKCVFVGPCTAKKMEFQQEHITGIDCVITFEELQALFDAREVNVENLEESLLDNASYYGRIFARSGGLSDAVAEALKEHGIPEDQFKANPIACDGIEECRIALLKANKNLLPNNFIEGMACVGGCIGGAACVTHGPKDKTEVNKYGQLAKEKTILDAIAVTQIAK